MTTKSDRLCRGSHDRADSPRLKAAFSDELVGDCPACGAVVVLTGYLGVKAHYPGGGLLSGRGAAYDSSSRFYERRSPRV